MGFKDLFKPKYTHHDWKIRLEAVKKLKDPKILEDIAKNDERYIVRKIAYRIAGMANTQEALMDIIKNDKDKYERLKIIEKITDQKLLKNLAKNDEERDIRIAAIKMLTDQRFLENLAKNEVKRDVRIAALKMLTDQKLLANFAMNDKEKRVRQAAIEKLDDRLLLSDIAKNSKFFDDRQLGYCRLEKEDSKCESNLYYFR